MEANTYQGKSLRCVTLEPDGYSPEVDYPLVIVLHGYGASMHDLVGLCPTIDRESYIYACPNGPLSLEMGPGQTGYAWMPRGGEATPEDAERAAGLLETFFDEILEQYHVPQGQVVLMGFSQGAGMTYRCGLGRPDMFAGLAALSGYLPDPEVLRGSLPAQRTQHIFIAHGVNDDIASMEKARQARAFLEEAGYHPQYKEYPMRHEISQQVVEDLVPWIKGVLPPAGA